MSNPPLTIKCLCCGRDVVRTDVSGCERWQGLDVFHWSWVGACADCGQIEGVPLDDEDTRYVLVQGHQYVDYVLSEDMRKIYREIFMRPGSRVFSDPEYAINKARDLLGAYDALDAENKELRKALQLIYDCDDTDSCWPSKIVEKALEEK